MGLWIVTSFRPSGKGGLYLDVGEDFGDAGHHLVAAQDRAALRHQVGDERAFAGALDDPGGEQSDGLGVVEEHSAGQPVAGDQAGHGEEELLDVRRGEVHAFAGRTWSATLSVLT